MCVSDFPSLQMMEAQGSPCINALLSLHSAYLDFSSILPLDLSIALAYYTAISLNPVPNVESLNVKIKFH